MKMLLLILAMAGPISAANAAGMDTPPTTAEPQSATNPADIEPGIGSRISNKGDFQLIEHGRWTPVIEPLRANNPVRTALNSPEQTTQPRTVTKAATNFRRMTFLPHVHAAEARFSIPQGLLDALIWTESRYNPLAVSKAGAAGLGQLMPGTAQDLGVLNRFDPKENVSGAARYLRQMLDRFGMVHLALAAYNAGPGAVDKAKGIPPNSETPSYVRSVLDRWGLQ